MSRFFHAKPLPFSVLAQNSPSTSTASIIFWCCALIILIFLLAVAIAVIRRNLSTKSQGPSQGFTLADLRQMRRNGSMNEEEFVRAKALVLRGLSAEEGTPEKSRPGGAAEAGDPTKKSGLP